MKVKETTAALKEKITALTAELSACKQLLEEVYIPLAEAADEAYFLVDRDCRYLFINNNMSNHLNIPVKEVIGKNYADFHGPENARIFADTIAEIFATGVTRQDEYVNREGTKIIYRTFYPVKSSPGEVLKVAILAQNITKLKEAEAALKKSEDRYRTIIENIEDGYYEIDLAGNYRFINEACITIFGYARSEILGFSSDKFMDWENRAKVSDFCKTVAATGQSCSGCEWEILRKNGERRYVESSISPMRDFKGDIVGLRGIIRDVTAKKKVEETIHHMAYHDFLTGLPNRFLFHDRLNMALAQARRNRGKIALITLDLDGFKDINDTLGHDIGDVLLQKVGKRLTGLIREGDTAARMGGDEFTLLLHSITDTSDVAIIAAKVLEALREPFDCDEHELSITPSIGIAIYPDHGLAMSTVLKNADQAMYRAKKTGNRYYVYGQ